MIYRSDYMTHVNFVKRDYWELPMMLNKCVRINYLPLLFLNSIEKNGLSFRRDSSQIDSIAFQDYIPLYFFENEVVLISLLPGVICSFEIKSFHISQGKGLLFYFLLNVFDIFEQLTYSDFRICSSIIIVGFEGDFVCGA